MKIQRIALAAVLGALALSALPLSEDPEPADAQVVAEQLPSYPLTTCVVSGLPLDKKGDPVDMVHEGRLVRLCCEGCKSKVAEKPAKYLEVIDTAVVAEQGPRYPTTTCVVSGEPIEDAVSVVRGTRLVRLCCKMCKRELDKDPVAYMAKLDEAWIAAQLPDYPLETCPVSGEELGSMGEPIDYLYGTRLVRLCCKGCKKGLLKDPQAALAKVAAASK